MEYKVITNHVPRFTIDAYKLSIVERPEFDYLNWDAIDRGEDSATFFRYKGTLYDLGEFMSCHVSCFGGETFPVDSPFRGWDGYMSDSFFSAVVVKYADVDSESVIVGMILS